MRAARLIFAIAAGGSVVSGCSQPHASEPKPPQPVKAQAVTAALPEPAVRYSASIEAFEQLSLAFKATGYVDDLLRRRGADGKLRTAQPGDHVAKGTVLARVRETDYRERVNRSRARLLEAEASLIKAGLDLERARTLFGAESLTKPELDSAQAAYHAAEARVSAARADVELDLAALRDCALVAPATGLILERRIEAGMLAGAGTVGFILGNVRSVKARFGVPDSRVHSVRPGDAIAVDVDALGGTRFTGRVTAVAPAADPQSRVFDVEVTIANQDGRLRPGMIGTVVLGQAASAARDSGTPPLAVPLTAIVRSDAGTGQLAVLVVQEENALTVARLRRVQLGEVTGNAIAVLEGLTPGERVVVSGAALLGDGDPVRVLP